MTQEEISRFAEIIRSRFESVVDRGSIGFSHVNEISECAKICVDEKIITVMSIKELFGAALGICASEDVVKAFRHWCDERISQLELIQKEFL